jgi:O-antigen ligase
LFRSKKLFLSVMVLAIILWVVAIEPLWVAETSLRPRLTLAGYAWQIFADHPLLGVGPTHYRSYVLIYYPLDWRTVTSGLLLPHNIWLYFLATTGIVGLIGIVWLIQAVVASSLGLYKKASDGFSKALALGVLGSLAGVFVNGLGGHFAFLPTYDLSHFYMVPMWILMGLMVSREWMETA